MPEFREETYIQFPLTLLALGSAFFEDTVRMMWSYGIVEAGRSMLLRDTGDTTPTLDECVEVGLHEINVPRLVDSTMINTYHDLAMNGLNALGREGQAALIRLRSDIATDALYQRNLNENDFRVLMAVYSVLGNKSFHLIRSDVIARRALGYHTERELEQLVVQRSDGRDSKLTPAKVKYSVEKLTDRGFFCTVVFAGRDKYFSNRLSLTQLRRAVYRARTRREENAARRRRASDEMTREIHLRRSELRSTTG